MAYMIGLDVTIVQNALTSIGLAYLAYLALNACGEIRNTLILSEGMHRAIYCEDNLLSALNL